MRKKIVFSTILGLIVLFISISMVELIFYSQGKTLLKPSMSFNSLFKESAIKSLKFIHGYSNNEDTLCSYFYEQDYRVIVWKIEKYSNLKTISFDTKCCIPDFYLTPYMAININNELSLNKKTIGDKEYGLEVKLEKNAKVFDIMSSSINFLAKRVGLGYPNKRPHIIINFQDEAKVIHIDIRRLNNKSVVIILYAPEGKKTGTNILKEIFN